MKCDGTQLYNIVVNRSRDLRLLGKAVFNVSIGGFSMTTHTHAPHDTVVHHNHNCVSVPPTSMVPMAVTLRRQEVVHGIMCLL
jgi:hypothetical protein